jgi:hypothetical protein
VLRAVRHVADKEPAPAELPETLDDTLAMLERMAAGSDVDVNEVATMRRRLLSGAPAPRSRPRPIIYSNISSSSVSPRFNILLACSLSSLLIFPSHPFQPRDGSYTDPPLRPSP